VTTVSRSPVRTVGADGLDLTLRERQVIDLLAEGMSTSEIAGQLGISGRTVKMFTARLMERFHVDRARRLPSAYYDAVGARPPSALAATPVTVFPHGVA
jgi:DNA-binding CsgD family transcriptional regulator